MHKNNIENSICRSIWLFINVIPTVHLSCDLLSAETPVEAIIGIFFDVNVTYWYLKGHSWSRPCSRGQKHHSSSDLSVRKDLIPQQHTTCCSESRHLRKVKQAVINLKLIQFSLLDGQIQNLSEGNYLKEMHKFRLKLICIYICYGQ